MSITELIRIINLFGTDHYSVQKTYFGVREKVDSDDSDGVVMHYHVDPISLNGNEMFVTIRVSFMDVINSNQSNERDVYSDTRQVAEHFMSYLSWEEPYYDVQLSSNASFEWFGGATDSDYAGHTVTLNVSLPFEYNYCDIPFSGSVSFSDGQNTISSFYEVMDSFQSNHYMVNGFHFGRTPEIDYKDFDGYLIWYFLADGSAQNGENELGFEALILSPLNADNENEEDVYSDALKIVQDLLGYLYIEGHNLGFQLNRDEITIEPMKHYPSSDYAGYSVRFGIKTRFDWESDKLPMYQHLVNEDGLFLTDHLGRRIQVA